MAVSDALKQVRPRQTRTEPGLEHPAFDPIMILTSLIGPAMVKSILSAGLESMAPEAAEQGFSQADMLASRLSAQAKSQAPLLKAEQAAQPLRNMYPDISEGINPMHGGRGIDAAESGFNVPDLKDPKPWTVYPESWAEFKSPMTGETFKGQGPNMKNLIESVNRAEPDQPWSVIRKWYEQGLGGNTQHIKDILNHMRAARN